ncbi:anti-sigma factor [Streptomyces sp. NPDC050658]|uniref:anti-sigma factor n=1 Tax=unclassified Streptomyces TaxID=2593676 RepID=UPI0034203102
MTGTDPHSLTGAYALDALDDEERAAFERHLRTCESCAEEVRGLAATAEILGRAVAAPPPPHLKQRVMREITGMPQEPPRTGPDAAPPTVAVRRRRAPQWALAACLAAAVGLGATAWWQHERADQARQEARAAQRQADRITRVLAAPDATVSPAELAGGARGSVIVSHDVDRAVFTASGMARPPGGKVYQLWFAADGRMRSAGLMDPSRTDQTVLLTGAVGDASGMGITVEPAGGSKQPTSKPLALVELPA